MSARSILMRGAPLVAALAACRGFAASSTPTQAPNLWGALERGPHDIGVTEIFLRDSTRPDVAAPGLAGRPMQIVVWYPATKSGTRRLTLRDYITLGAGSLGPAMDTPERRASAMRDFTASPIEHRVSAARLDSVLDAPMAGQSNTPHIAARAPLVVFLHTTPMGQSVMSEYLASHGFVVAGIQSKGVREPAYRLSRENLDAMVQDAAFVVQRMRREPYVGEELGIIGMSNGSIAALALQLSGVTPAAVVSLDGGIGERAGGTYLAERTTGDPARIMVPLLHLYTPDNPSLDFQYLRSYTRSARTLVRVGHLRHGDFLTYGPLERAIPGAFGDARPDAAIGFEWVSRYAMRFHESHVKRDSRTNIEALSPPPGLIFVEHVSG